MKTIEVNGHVADIEVKYKLDQPLLNMEYWQIRLGTECIGTLHRSEGNWSARANQDSYLGEYEILTFIEVISEHHSL